MSDNPILTIPEEAQEEILKPQVRALSQNAGLIVRQQFLFQLFGPRMKATTRTLLMLWTARRAINAHDYGDRFVREAEEHCASLV